MPTTRVVTAEPDSVDCRVPKITRTNIKADRRTPAPALLRDIDDSYGLMSGEDTEIIIKGELHSSRGDLAHERKLLVEGVDHLVLEGPEREAEYGLLQTWYAFAMLLTNYLFFRILQTDSSVLEDIAEAQDAEVTKTRESDASVLENSHILARIGAAALFLVLFFAAALFGIAEIHIYGVPLLIASAILPVLLLRIHESNRSAGSRDEQMAQLIIDAAEDGGRVVAVVGDDHADPVIDHLPEGIDVVREVPKYPWYSWQHAKDIAYPSFVFVSVLWIVYTLFVAYARFAWTLS